jgi:NitT/TauT family transport system permease protein
LLEPYVAALQSVPKVAVAPILGGVARLRHRLQGRHHLPAHLLPGADHQHRGFKAVDPDRIDLLRSLSATRWQIFRKAKFPSACPSSSPA